MTFRIINGGGKNRNPNSRKFITETVICIYIIKQFIGKRVIYYWRLSISRLFIELNTLLWDRSESSAFSMVSFFVQQEHFQKMLMNEIKCRKGVKVTFSICFQVNL